MIFRRTGGKRATAVRGSIFGVGFTIDAGSSELLDTALALMPPAWILDEPGVHALDLRLELSKDGDHVLSDGERQRATGTLESVAEDFDRVVRLHLAYNAPDHLFLHAGAVGYRGRGIVVPGASFSGKTSLVAALVRAGAEYYSDENAVFDSDGMLHPYPKPLGLRETPGERTQTNRCVTALGGTSGQLPIPMTLVVAAAYRPGAEWHPEPLSPSEIITCLLQHTFRGLDRPKESLGVLHRAAAQARGLRGERGEADGVAAELLARLDASG